MKTLDTSAIGLSVGMPLKGGTLLFLQLAYKEALTSLQQATIGTKWLSTVPYVLTGCVNSGSGTNYVISAGAVAYDGEVYQVPAASFTASGSNVPVATITTTQFLDVSADPVTFTDGVPRYVHDINSMTLGPGLSGSGTVNYSSFFFPQNVPVGGIGQIIDFVPPTADLSWFGGSGGLGNNPYTLGWAIANGNNGTINATGAVTVGYKSGDSDFGTLSATGGEKTHVLSTTEMPSHTHVEQVYAAANTGGTTPAGYLNTTGGLVNDGTTTAATGGGGAHNNLQPFIVVLKIQRIS
jgi:hypothetical protein